MTEEQNKLAEEFDTLHKQLTEVRATVDEIETMIEREPATEAVLEDLLDCLDNLSNGSGFDLTDSPKSYMMQVKSLCAEARALKGKGASQGASSIAASQVKNDVPGLSSDSNSSLPVGAAPTIDQVIASMELSVAADGAIIYDWSPLEKRARELEAAVAAPEPSGEFVRVPREPTPEMIQAMEDRQIEGATYIAENSIQYALWREVWKAALAASPPMSRRDEDAKR